jgi:hypothetical protein
MLTNAPLRAPQPLEFLVSFGIEPVESMPHDGYWCYLLADASGQSLRLSFNIHEASVQAVLSCDNGEIVRFSHEAGIELRCTPEGVIEADFQSRGMRTKLQIQTKPRLSLSIASLLSER